MRICGISFDSTVAIFVIVDFSDDTDVKIVDAETKRADLGNHEDDACLKRFHRLIATIVSDFGIEKIAIRKCTYSGKYQSGAASMKMEAILQLADVPTFLIAPKSANAACGKIGCVIPDELNKYQHDAFKVAFTLAAGTSMVK